ncbi:MAG: glutamyl-tRNA reductase [Syntrophus sp. (in: bacteria)]|nr:glutamyl-tRNA reductase [Syntrophus sp. (in: bacteria)]
MHIVAFGLNHNTAPVEVRERLYIQEETLPSVLQGLKRRGIDETVVLSTCNRTEVYCSSSDCEESLRVIKKTLTDHLGIKPEWLKEFTYSFFDEDAYRHLFLVASGLDSMIVGEPQILGQAKDAYRFAAFQDTTGFLLNKVFHRTFNVAKRVRSETKIGYNPVSISSMAVELSKKIFLDVSQKRILVIGAGEMCEIALRHFKKEGVNEIFITNRTLQNAQKLAEEHLGIPCPFNEIPDLLTKVDMVISSTGADKPIIEKDLVQSAMKKRKYRPLFFIDIAVPRDIDPLANNIENVYLYDIDDLKDLSQKHLVSRVKESEKAYGIVEEEVALFSQWLKQLDMTPIITSISRKVEKIRSSELKKALQKVKGIDEDTLARIDIMTRSIVNKLLHPHLALIRQDGSPEVLEVMKNIFQIEDEHEDEMDHRDKGEQACPETNGHGDKRA